MSRLIEIVDTKLADRNATLEQQLVRNSPPGDHTSVAGKAKSTSTAVDFKAGNSQPHATDDLLRSDLALAQRSKASLEAEAIALRAQVLALTSKTAIATNLAAGLLRDKAALETKLRDREEEIREKKRLVERVQDEMVGLEMEINVTGDKMVELRRENEELVRRWMETKGKEAEKMNQGSGWQ